MATVAALVFALLLTSAAAAQAPQRPLTGTVQQAVGSVTGATSGVTQTAATATQPVTDAVAQTTAPVAGAVQGATTHVTTTARETVSRVAPSAQPVVHEVGDTTAAVVAGVTEQARESTPAPSGAQRPVAHSPAPPARVRTSQAGRRHRDDSSGSRAGAPQAQSAGLGDRGETRGRVSTDGPVAADSGDDAAKRANGLGSGFTSPEMPATASGSVSGASGGFGLGGLALLALALRLAIPSLLQRLPAVPAMRRPLLLVSLLERPG